MWFLGHCRKLGSYGKNRIFWPKNEISGPKNSLLDSNHVGEKMHFFTLSYVIAYIYMYYALQSGNDPLKGDLTFAYLYLSNIGLKTELFA